MPGAGAAMYSVAADDPTDLAHVNLSTIKRCRGVAKAKLILIALFSANSRGKLDYSVWGAQLRTASAGSIFPAAIAGGMLPKVPNKRAPANGTTKSFGSNTGCQ